MFKGNGDISRRNGTTTFVRRRSKYLDRLVASVFSQSMQRYFILDAKRRVQIPYFYTLARVAVLTITVLST